MGHARREEEEEERVAPDPRADLASDDIAEGPLANRADEGEGSTGGVEGEVLGGKRGLKDAGDRGVRVEVRVGAERKFGAGTGGRRSEGAGRGGKGDGGGPHLYSHVWKPKPWRRKWVGSQKLYASSQSVMGIQTAAATRTRRWTPRRWPKSDSSKDIASRGTSFSPSCARAALAPPGVRNGPVRRRSMAAGRCRIVG